jgi:hypothetical protein
MTKADLLTELEIQGLAAAPLQEGGPLWSVEGICLRLNRVTPKKGSGLISGPQQPPSQGSPEMTPDPFFGVEK